MEKELIHINYESECEFLRKRVAELEAESIIRHTNSATLVEIKNRLKEIQYVYEKEKLHKRLEELKKKKEYIEEEIQTLITEIAIKERNYWKE